MELAPRLTHDFPEILHPTGIRVATSFVRAARLLLEFQLIWMVEERLAGSVACATLAVFGGAKVVRAHDVAATKVDLVSSYSRQHQHPLQCVMEEA